jgi:hypothetical protein
MGYGLDGPGSIPRKIFLFSTMSRPALRPAQPPTEWVPGTIFLRVKWLGREGDHSLPSSAEIKKGEAITPFPVCLHGTVRN